jgi:hypothetical protein
MGIKLKNQNNEDQIKKKLNQIWGIQLKKND